MNIAEITVNQKQAMLDNRGKWSSTDKPFEVYLNNRFNPLLVPPSPSAGHTMFEGQAIAASESLRAELRWFAVPGGEEGVVY